MVHASTITLTSVGVLLCSFMWLYLAHRSGGGPFLFNMPIRPKSICTYPGCGRLTDGLGGCALHRNHARKDSDKRRESSTDRGYDGKWRKARRLHLLKQPLCVHCLKTGKRTPATDVDHVIPHKGDMALFWDMSNWQSLCHSCHSIKTARYDGAFGAKVRSGTHSDG